MSGIQTHNFSVALKSCICKIMVAFFVWFYRSMVEYFRSSLIFWNVHMIYTRGHRGRDHMVVGFITIYAISAYHHYMLLVRILLRQGVLVTALCDKVCHRLATGRWFTPVSRLAPLLQYCCTKCRRVYCSTFST